jgi:hypothetical protein
MPVSCPSCEAVIPADDIELSTRLAKCRGCNEVFPLDLPGTAPPPRAEDGGIPPIPTGVRVTDDGVTRQLEYRWFTPVAFFLVFFCIAWDGFLVFWYTMALGNGPGGGFGWLLVVFPVVHVAVGLGLTYFTLCLFVNRTRITVDDRLRVQHGPLFWPGGVNVTADGLTRLYCERVVSNTKRGVSVSFKLMATTADGRAVPLLSGLDGLPRAKFFERQLEAWLGLPPTPVPGEAL